MTLAAFEDALAKWCLAADPDPALLDVLGGDPVRWRLYRNMVRTRFRRTAREALPHVVRAAGDAGFDELMVAFHERGLPESRLFRDVAVELAEFVASTAGASEVVDAALLDAAIIDVRDEEAPDEVGEPRFDFEAPARLIAASRVVQGPGASWVVYRRTQTLGVRFTRVPVWFARWIAAFTTSATPGEHLRAMLASGTFEASMLPRLSEVLAELVDAGALVVAEPQRPQAEA